MKIHKIDQRSKEWEQLRVGKIGGSEAIGLTTPARMKTLLYKKVAEIQTGEQESIFVTEAMQHGIDTESIVIAKYEAETFLTVEQVGYITNSKYKYLGLSPDGLIGNALAIEVKCPTPKVHCQTIIEDAIPTGNRPQIAQYFLVNDKLDWVDFVSYNEKIKAEPMHIIRVTREDFSADVSKLEAVYLKFEVKIDEYLKLF